MKDPLIINCIIITLEILNQDIKVLRLEGSAISIALVIIHIIVIIKFLLKSTFLLIEYLVIFGVLNNQQLSPLQRQKRTVVEKWVYLFTYLKWYLHATKQPRREHATEHFSMYKHRALHKRTT